MYFCRLLGGGGEGEGGGLVDSPVYRPHLDLFTAHASASLERNGVAVQDTDTAYDVGTQCPHYFFLVGLRSIIANATFLNIIYAHWSIYIYIFI